MLNCMATCRCMDKKPCGNTLKTPAFKKLVDGITFDSIEGGAVMKSSQRFSGSVINHEACTGIVKSEVESSASTLSRINGLTPNSGIVDALLAGNPLGKFLPLCQVTGTE